MRIICTLLYCGCIVGSTKVSAQMNLTGEIRPRAEYRHGYQLPLDSAVKGAAFTSQRTRLNFGYSAEKLKAGISLQDVRVWGYVPQTISAYADAPTFIHQAWGQYWLSPEFSVKAGRQEIVYNDERILGSVNWAQQARAHDALVLAFEDTSLKFNAHIGAAYNQNAQANIATSYTVPSNYKEIQYIWLNKKSGGLSASILFLNNGNQSPVTVNSTRYFQTTGTHIEYKKSALFASARFYYQSGVDANKNKMQAYMGGADIAYTLTEKITCNLGAEHMSGQSQTDTSKAYKEVNRAFNTLYATGHKFNGLMDYFFAGSAHGNVGLTDVYLSVKFKNEKGWAALKAHQFMAAADVLNKKELAATGQYTSMDPNLGAELDFEIAINLNSSFAVQAGYSQYFPTSTIASLKAITNYKGEGETGETANWSYLMLVFKPNFLK